jgi:UDP-glucose 4-epimerase
MIMNNVLKHKNKTLVVTGAGGFLGRSLVNRALETGWKVRALVHNKNPYKSNHQALTVVKWDLAKVDEISDVFDDSCIVVHSAAHIPSNYDAPQTADDCYKYNVLGTLQLLKIANERNIAHFVYYSAGNAYAIKNKPVVEEDSLYPSGKAVIYLSSKISGEMLVNYFSHVWLFPATILRISSPYGPDNSSFFNRMLVSLKNNTPISLHEGGCHSADFVYVDDIINATLKSIDTLSTGIFNIGSGTRITLLEIADMVVDILKANKDLINVEPLSSCNVIQRYPLLDCTKAHRQWGYSPMSLKHGLQKMV